MRKSISIIRRKRVKSNTWSAGISMLIGIIVFIHLLTPRFSEASHPWPMYAHDPQHTGKSPYIGPQTDDVLWTLPLDEYRMSQPAIASDGTIYMAGISGTSGGRLYAISPEGTSKWQSDSIPISGYCCFFSTLSPTIGSDGTIYIGGVSGLYAFNPGGSIKWNFVPDFPYKRGLCITVSPNGIIYATADHNTAPYDYLFALNPDGSLRWIAGAGDLVGLRYPALGEDGTIYIARSGRSASYSGVLQAFTSEGALKWSQSSLQTRVSDPVIGPNGTIYIQDTSRSISYSSLKAFNPDGDLLWTKEISSGCDYSLSYYKRGIGPAIYGDAMIVVSGCHDLQAFDLDGTPKWTLPFDPTEMPRHSVIDADGTVYVGTNSSDNTMVRIYAIKPDDGAIKWSHVIGPVSSCSLRSPPALSSDGTLYVSVYEEGTLYLYAFGSPITDNYADGFVFPVTKDEPVDPDEFVFNRIDPLSDGWAGKGVGETSAAKGHLGQDYYLKSGTTAGKRVYAAANGTVFRVTNNQDTQYGWCDQDDHGWGRVIVIKHEAPPGIFFDTTGSIVSDNYREEDDRSPGSTEKNPTIVYTLYGHLSKMDFEVEEGDPVNKGQPIARIGSYPDDIEEWDTPHLHFEIKSQKGFDEGVWSEVNPGTHLKPQSCFTVDEESGIGSGYSYIENYAPERYNPSVFIKTNTSTLITPSGGTARSSDGSAAVFFPLNAVSDEIWVFIIEVYEAFVPPPNEGWQLLGGAYDFSAFDAEGNPVTDFYEPLDVSIQYDPNDLNGLDEGSLTLHYYDLLAGIWMPLSSIVDPVTHTVTGETDHFSIFAIFGIPEPSTILLFGAGLLGILIFARRTLKKRK